MFPSEYDKQELNIILDNVMENEYSELMVLQSAAGYYVGTVFHEYMENDSYMFVPGSRDSEYFSTFEETKNYLKFLTN